MHGHNLITLINQWYSRIGKIRNEKHTASVMHCVWLWTFCCPNISPQSMHDNWAISESQKSLLWLLFEYLSGNETAEYFSQKKEKKRKTTNTGNGDLGGTANSEVIGKLRLLQILATIFTLKPHHLFSRV